MVLSVAVTGPMSVPHLKIFCEQIKERMLRSGDITQVDILGFSDHQIRVEIAARTLMQFGLSISAIADKITSQSLDLPSGIIETRDADVLVRFADERRTVRELEDLIVLSGETGAEIRLGDIARITDRFTLKEEKVLFNGRRAWLLQINKTKSQDALKVMQTLEAILEREQQMAPPDVEFTITQNVSKIVSDRLQLLVINGMQGENLNRLKQASLDFMHGFNTYEGVLDLTDDLRPGKPEIRVRLKKGAAALGLDAFSIASQLRSAFHGKTAREIQVGSESYKIDVQLALQDKNCLADLEYFHITTDAGKQVPLAAVATLDTGRGFARISRINSRRTVTIRGDVDTKTANTNEIIPWQASSSTILSSS